MILIQVYIAWRVWYLLLGTLGMLFLAPFLRLSPAEVPFSAT